jgi:hypothetical protein
MMTATENVHPLACPCCHLTDQTQRVQAAYRARFSRSSTRGLATGVSYYSDGGFVPTVTGFSASTT